VRAEYSKAAIPVTEGVIVTEPLLRRYVQEAARPARGAKIVWAPAEHYLGNPCNAHPTAMQHQHIADDLETIFDLYRIGAICDSWIPLGWRQDFLARNGLAIRVREPDVLGYPEQIKDWASTRFAPLDRPFFR